MTPEYNFITEWDEDGSHIPDWQLEGRRILNKAIRTYNDWQREGFNPSQRRRVLAEIEYARQVITEKHSDGGQAWLEECDKMQEFVERFDARTYCECCGRPL